MPRPWSCGRPSRSGRLSLIHIFQRASLSLHAFFAGLQHIRLYALPGGLGGGADGVADGLNRAGADAVAFGVVNIVVAALAFGYEMCIRDSPGDVVIDPVAGSGTTLRAAYELGRSAYGFEVDKSFYEAAREKMLAPILAEKTTI